jgi:hypothetical protein
MNIEKYFDNISHESIEKEIKTKSMRGVGRAFISK